MRGCRTPSASAGEHRSGSLREWILSLQIHTWWHGGVRMLDSELELWREDAPGWRSKDSRTAVKLCSLKSTAVQFPEDPFLVEGNRWTLQSLCSFVDYSISGKKQTPKFCVFIYAHCGGHRTLVILTHFITLNLIYPNLNNNLQSRNTMLREYIYWSLEWT